VEYADHIYGSNCNLEGINYSIYDRGHQTLSPRGYARLVYRPGLNVVYYYDATPMLTGYDSILLNSSGIKSEEWNVRFSPGGSTTSTQKIYVNHHSANPDAAQPGDLRNYYSNGALQGTQRTDSVYYNSYGADTLAYSTARTSSGKISSVTKVRKVYTDCR
jgi:hypothetical protein